MQFVLKKLLVLPPASYGVVILLVASYWIKPQFLSLPFLMLLMRQAAPLALVAMGQTFVIVNRSLDLSVGSVIAMVNVILASKIWQGMNPMLPMTVALLAGLVVGMINGVFIAKLKASAVVVTLGTASVLTGLILIISGGTPGDWIHPTIKWIGRNRIGIFPISLMIWICIAIVLWLILRKLILGQFIYASGDNFSSSKYCGIPVEKSLFFSHALCGMMAALSGVCLSGYIGVGVLNLGQDYILDSITVVIMGGAVFGGGQGGIWGTSLGVVMLTVLLNLLAVYGIDESGKLIIQGLFLVGITTLYGLKKAQNG